MAAPAKSAAKKSAAKKPAKAAVSAAPKAAASAKKFNLEAVLNKFWAAPDSTVVGTVDGATVTKGELLKSMWFQPGNAPSRELTNLLNQKMIEQAAKKAGVTLTPAEQKAKEEEAVQKTGLQSVDQILSQFGLTREKFTEAIRISALAEKMAMKQLSVTDADYAEYIKARHILVRFSDTEKDQAKKEADAKKKIDEIAAKVKAGEDFAKLADEYSEDPGNVRDGKKQGGDLGWFSRGRMVQEFENAAFALKVGQVSEPVKTFYGYHIIKLEAIGKDASAAQKAELKSEIIKKKLPMAMQTWFAQLQSSAKINNMLAEPQAKEPTPVMRPQAPKPTVRPVAPKTAPQPAPQPAPAAGDKPANVPPPPPPPAP